MTITRGDLTPPGPLQKGVYSRKCAFHGLLITSASYTECTLYLAPANDRQATGSSN